MNAGLESQSCSIYIIKWLINSIIIITTITADLIRCLWTHRLMHTIIFRIIMLVLRTLRSWTRFNSTRRFSIILSRCLSELFFIQLRFCPIMDSTSTRRTAESFPISQSWRLALIFLLSTATSISLWINNFNSFRRQTRNRQFLLILLQHLPCRKESWVHIPTLILDLDIT